MWRSLVARFVRDEEAAGSNPVTPTMFGQVSDLASVHCGSANGPVGGNWEDPLLIMDLAQATTTTLRHNWPVGLVALRDMRSSVSQRASTALNSR